MFLCLCAVNNDRYEYSTFGLFLIGENDLFTTITTQWKPDFRCFKSYMKKPNVDDVEAFSLPMMVFELYAAPEMKLHGMNFILHAVVGWKMGCMLRNKELRAKLNFTTINTAGHQFV